MIIKTEILRTIEDKGEIFVDGNYHDDELGVIPFGHWLTAKEQADFEAKKTDAPAIFATHKDAVRQKRIDDIAAAVAPGPLELEPEERQR